MMISRFFSGRRGAILVTAALCLALPGLANAVTYTFDQSWGAPGFTLVQQDAAGAEVNFSVPYMELVDVSINGEAMTEIVIPGVQLPNEAGSPNLPVASRYLALPQGAYAELRVIEYRSEVYHNVNVAPA
ncbi:MAG: hypothetical protein C4524_05935, partial [Candidatus Zixiibacteriota bacterium]